MVVDSDLISELEKTIHWDSVNLLHAITYPLDFKILLMLSEFQTLTIEELTMHTSKLRFIVNAACRELETYGLISAQYANAKELEINQVAILPLGQVLITWLVSMLASMEDEINNQKQSE
jgi:hypothetical protein